MMDKEFEEWWATLGKHVGKYAAWLAYQKWSNKLFSEATAFTPEETYKIIEINALRLSPENTKRLIKVLCDPKVCPHCQHSLNGNMHGPDQNDYGMEGNQIIYLGSCTYCKVCFKDAKA